MFKSIWCALFHRRWRYQKYAAGDYKIMRCDCCNITWPEAR